jgi:ADP-ribosylglycohydrolase
VARAADQRPAAHAIRVRPARHSPCASIAYRLARAAAGDADAALGLAGMAAYDVAAGHALLRGVGGVLLNEAGREVTYSANGIGPVRHAFGGTPAAAAALAARRDWDNLGPAVAFRPPFCLHLPRPGRAVADPGVLARAQGCLLGQFAGDSLGGLVEFCSVESIRERYPDGVRDLADGGTWHNLAGQLTDDSEMALMLARSLVHRGRHDPAAVLDAYCHWWPDAFDHGGTLRAAIGPAVGLPPADRLASVERTANAASQSNGSLMRISPLGVWGAFGTGAAEAARADSRLTHPNPACVDACAALVAAIAHAVRHGDGPEAAHAAAVAEARESAVRAALEAARQTPPADYVANMGWVLTALQNAFWQLLHAPSLEAGVIDTVSRGGDTDTTAAIAGALLGAVHGRDAVPDRWRRAVLTCRPLPGTATRHPRPMEFWPVDALELAEALLAAGRDGAAV